MNKRQIEALTALRDVMHKHNIYFDAGYDDFEILSSKNKEVIGFFPRHKLFASEINELLEQETE